MSAPILVLGGTTEARSLCAALAAEGIAAEVSLAGAAPAAPYPVPMRVGGFAAAGGLGAHLIRGGYRALIDATHPFAARMPWQAAAAASGTGVPHLMLKRPPWTPGPGEEWVPVADLAAAAAILPEGARVFLATGAQSLPAFSSRSDLSLTLRQLSAAADPAPHIAILQDKPGDLASETALFCRLGLTHLVAKNAGGPTRAKLDAARDLGVSVIMVARPPLPAAPLVTTVAAALDWARGLA